MAAGKCKDRDVEKLRQAIASFGFSVAGRGKRIFVIYPGADEIFICMKLPRAGFWELNRVNRDLWELHGATGISIFEYISTQEVIKWFYDLALQTPAIMEGLELSVKEFHNLGKHADRLRLRERENRDLKHEYEMARRRKRNKMLQEKEERDRKLQDKLRERIKQKERQSSHTTKRQSKRQS